MGAVNCKKPLAPVTGQEIRERLALVTRFERNADSCEEWLDENRKLVAQENFGSDLASVQATLIKHEAWERDIKANEERVIAVVSEANELEHKNYGNGRVRARKDKVLQSWNNLLEQLKARRLKIEFVFGSLKDINNISSPLEKIEEIKSSLMSEDYGKDLKEVEDLLQKQSLLEEEISVFGKQITSINKQASGHTDDKSSDREGYQPQNSEKLKDDLSVGKSAYDELSGLATKRRKKLEECRKFWQLYQDIDDEKKWIKEKEKVLSSDDMGYDLTSTNQLLVEHKAIEEEITQRHTQFIQAQSANKQQIKNGDFDLEQFKQRTAEISSDWSSLTDLANQRKERLNEAVQFYQFFADADEVDTWLVTTHESISSEEVGKDEESAGLILKKHMEVATQVENYQSVIKGLHERAAVFRQEDCDNRLSLIDGRYEEILEFSKLRKQRLKDASSLFKLFSSFDSVETLINEKENFLTTITFTDNAEQFEHEINATASKVAEVEELAAQCLNQDPSHPNDEEIMMRRNHLKKIWENLKQNFDHKKADVNAER